MGKSLAGTCSSRGTSRTNKHAHAALLCAGIMLHVLASGRLPYSAQAGESGCCVSCLARLRCAVRLCIGLRHTLQRLLVSH